MKDKASVLFGQTLHINDKNKCFISRLTTYIQVSCKIRGQFFIYKICSSKDEHHDLATGFRNTTSVYYANCGVLKVSDPL